MQSNSAMLSPVERRLIRASFGKLARMHHEASLAFYDRLRETDPKLSTRLNCKSQYTDSRLIESLALIVTALDSPQTMQSHVDSIKHKNDGLALTAQEYSELGQVFLWVIESCLETEFSTKVQQAWKTLIRVLIDMALTPNSNPVDAGAM